MGVILAGLSTTVGFCSLIISTHQGIHSLGVLTTIGSLCVLAAAVPFLPGLLRAASNVCIWRKSPAAACRGAEGDRQYKEEP
jgi:predicted RND superfamily exporter protein